MKAVAILSSRAHRPVACAPDGAAERSAGRRSAPAGASAEATRPGLYARPLDGVDLDEAARVQVEHERQSVAAFVRRHGLIAHGEGSRG